MVGEARTGHGRDVRRDTAFSLYFCELKGRSEFEEGVAAENGTDEDAVGFEGLSDLDEDTCGVDDINFFFAAVSWVVLIKNRRTWEVIHPV